MVGDYDPSGEHLFNSLAEDVIAFAQAAGADVEFERLAVTSEQIATYDLPTAPPKATDRRSFSGIATTQAEALPPDILPRSYGRPSKPAATPSSTSGPWSARKPSGRPSVTG